MDASKRAAKRWSATVMVEVTVEAADKAEAIKKAVDHLERNRCFVHGEPIAFPALPSERELGSTAVGGRY